MQQESKVNDSLGIKGDRNDLYLQKGGEKLIQDVAKGCGNGRNDVVVIIHTVGPVILENFIDIPNIKAVVIAHLPGTESGNAIVDVLFGDVNPSGCLPYTIAKKEDDYGPTSKIKYIPTPSDGLAPQQNFSEGLYIDYRHFDKHDIAPRYEFGFGLSYTQFQLSNQNIAVHGIQTPLPAPRVPGLTPPSYSMDIPDPKSALFPEGWHKVEKYIYPWLDSVEGITKSPTPFQEQRPLSDAGGGPGGNPDLYTSIVTLSVLVENIGSRDGASVIQLYISFPENYRDHETGEPVDFPVRVLRGFEKVAMAASQQQEVTFEVTRRDISYWDVKRQNWVMPQGEFSYGIGFSSRDLPIQGKW